MLPRFTALSNGSPLIPVPIVPRRILQLMTESLVDYYRRLEFNPVPIQLESDGAWRAHVLRRRNLYERQLGLPLSWLRGRRVLEFGCNSGENPAVLASMGALLTLVEPNEQVIPDVVELFESRGLTDQIENLFHSGAGDFPVAPVWDLVIAEGFLFSLHDRDAVLRRICGCVGPGGVGVVSFNDRVGMVPELLKRMTAARLARMRGATIDSDVALEGARELFGEDFGALCSSRPFAAWWRDSLVSPFVCEPYLWSYAEIGAILEAEGACFRASSPAWTDADRYSWYKRVQPESQRWEELAGAAQGALPFLLTGWLPTGRNDPASDQVMADLSHFTKAVSAYTEDPGVDVPAPPDVLLSYLATCDDPRVQRFAEDVGELCEAVAGTDPGRLLRVYRDAVALRAAWGAPYHYICFDR